MSNARRLLVPLRVNQAVREALKKWATEWRAALAQLRKKP